ncbi:TNF receptor-associated factor 6-like [Diabrotica undecimpunctata]|uniref:TNF receptor-associated factor 6-like n=1 Tax=Diabrotica undecimpunctata TaxID=50387 RepID=UPI003B638DBC
MAKSGVYDTNKSELSVAEESSINDALGPEARFECPICLAWLRDPVLTSCGHRFCRNCIYPWLERGKACPVDNMKLNEADIFPDNFTRREISQQRTKCPNIVRGCLAELSPLDIEAHLLVCEYRIPELPDNEKLRCSFVDVGCNEKFEDEPKLTKHLEEHIQKHLALLSKAYSSLSINKNEPTSSSSIAQQANFWDPPPKNSEPSALQDDNLQELLKTLYEKIVYLEQKSREQDIIIANMSQQIASQSLPMTKLNQLYCNGCYLWYVSDFKSKMTAMRENPHVMYYSTGFYTSPNGYKLCVRLNLSPKDNNYIAILIHVMKTDHDHTLDWPFTGKLSIILVHPTQSFRSIKETMITRPELDAFKRPVQDMNSKGFGYTEFALLEEIVEQDFISNNQLLIKVQAQTV